MKSKTNRQLWDLYAELPAQVQNQAKRAYRQFTDDPSHRELHFKRVHPDPPIYSVRIGLHYRAVGVVDGDEIVWFWIGSHSDYDKLLEQL